MGISIIIDVVILLNMFSLLYLLHCIFMSVFISCLLYYLLHCIFMYVFISVHRKFTVSLVMIIGYHGYVGCAPSLDVTPDPPQKLDHHVLDDAHYEDLREMIEHFDRKLDDVLCKTEKHLLEVKSGINEKVLVITT